MVNKEMAKDCIENKECRMCQSKDMISYLNLGDMPTEKMIKKCFICGNKDFKFLYYNKDRLYGVPGRFRIEKCKLCGLIFVNPSPKDLGKYYPGDYYSFNKIRECNNFKMKYKLLLYKLNHYNSRPFLKFLLTPTRQFVRHINLNNKKRLLDVGCGSGQFLYEMGELGLTELHGVEPYGCHINSKKYNLNIKKCSLLSAKYPSNYFYTITLCHSLEHMDNPVEILKEIKRILKRKGELVIEVPNTNSFNFWIFGKRWFNLDTPRHLYNYNDKNLTFYLESLGFKIKKIRYKGNTLSLSSLNYFFTERGFKIDKKIIGFFSYINSILFDKILSIFKLGEHIEIICEKE